MIGYGIRYVPIHYNQKTPLRLGFEEYPSHCHPRAGGNLVRARDSSTCPYQEVARNDRRREELVREFLNASCLRACAESHRIMVSLI